MHSSAAFDLLGDGLDSLISGQSGANMGMGMSMSNQQNLASLSAPSPLPVSLGGLADIFSGLGMSSSVGTASYVAPKQCWLTAQKGKGLEINGTFARRNGAVNMDLELVNKALQPMTGFAIQLNKNSFGLICANPLVVPVLQPNQSMPVNLVLSTNGPVLKMNPINNLQIAVKNNVDVFYFSLMVPMHVYFVEDGEIDKRLFLNTWKEIPEQNETQYQLSPLQSLGVVNSDDVCNKLRNNNVFTIAKRNVEGQDMLYQSMKLTNGIWILAELKVTPGNPSLTVRLLFFFVGLF